MTVARALEVLGLSGKPSPDEIRRAYLRQVKQHPPERDRDGFQRVREAFDFLKGNPWLLIEEQEQEQEQAERDDEEEEDDEREGEEEREESEALELDGPSFPNAELERQLEELNEALAHDDPVAGARAMVALYGRPALSAGPVPPPLFCLRTFMVLVERQSFEEAHALLAAFEKHAALHYLEAGFGAEVGARWRLAREVSAICDLDQPLASAVARGLRTGNLYPAAGQVERAMADRLERDAPTIWGMLVPLLTPPPQPETPRMSQIGAWPFGVVVVVLINLMRFCLPSSSTMSSAYNDDKPGIGSIADQQREPVSAPEGAPSFSPQLTFRERAELQAEQTWKSLQASLERGDCEGVRDQWSLYRAAATGDIVDAASHASRKQRILEMCAELQPLLEDKP